MSWIVTRILAITGTSFKEAVLWVTQNLVDIKVLHYLIMDNVFHCLAAYGGEEIGLQFAGHSCLHS